MNTPNPNWRARVGEIFATARFISDLGIELVADPGQLHAGDPGHGLGLVVRAQAEPEYRDQGHPAVGHLPVVAGRGRDLGRQIQALHRRRGVAGSVLQVAQRVERGRAQWHVVHAVGRHGHRTGDVERFVELAVALEGPRPLEALAQVLYRGGGFGVLRRGKRREHGFGGDRAVEDRAAIESALDDLMQKSHKLAELLYQETSKTGEAGEPAAGSAESEGDGENRDDDVIDADFTVKN